MHRSRYFEAGARVRARRRGRWLDGCARWRGPAAGLALSALVCLAGCPQSESVTCPSGRICPKGYTCAPNQDICIFGPCGNGALDDGEKCDDGNLINDDHCNKSCSSNNECGNGIIDRFDDANRNEACDDGELNGQPGHCGVGCKSTGLCGNGLKDNGEDCDYCLADDAAIDASLVDASSSDAPGDGPLTSSDGATDTRTDTGTGADPDGDRGVAPDAGPINPVCKLGILESRLCNSDCTTIKCGDGKINHAAGEECDDRGESPGCNIDCTNASCGDGRVNRTAGEECDVPGAPDTANCNGKPASSFGVACHFRLCGDGYVNPAAGETCDVVGGADTARCNGKLAPPGAACHASMCGDGWVNVAAGETCDVLGGADTATCNGSAAGAAACHLATCGDGYVNHAANETCEVPSNGADTATCNGTGAPAGLHCKTVICGDGYVNDMAGETCEVQANGADTVTCNGAGAGPARCKVTSCGDGWVNSAAGETCEVSATGANTATCNGIGAGSALACHVASCGDGYANSAAGEDCDRLGGGNSLTCNGTSAGAALRCKSSFCGDGYINTDAGEACDDHNMASDDGCSAGCQLEPGFTCPTPGTACVPSCGDGDVVSGEACDDYNAKDCGTCGATCSTAQPPRAATGSITVGDSGDTGGNPTFVSGETFTIADGIHAPFVFQFDGTGGPPQATKAFILIGGSQSQMANRIAAAISGVGRALAVNAGVNGSQPRQVLLTNGNPGAAGNQPIVETVADGKFTVSGMSNGVAYDCGAGDGCRDGRDCGSAVCCLGVAGSVDCPCATGMVCTLALHTCVAPGCQDKVLNGTESDVDCGGASCTRCADGAGCLVDGDCGADSACKAGICQSTCGDGFLNGTESDTDCGGVSVLCSRCAVSRRCNVTSDCVGGSTCGLPPGPDAGAPMRVCL